ncbi:hypothetical protein DUF364 [Gottschalkia acidurici 9a]|uniref:Heavy-metal chelation domain-containing protein n=1 Tax=Gottschalkia acidurici (strain ATCC 7906 / DSM 604 / BCRC 14475 / CIP 104303 / KCTC 5404 / NCIMB 10678 / 9a) TaxID=1128398 RepID=K0B1I6_GOTA9|nr:DUF364 domain-containing protein [Gottschalkia acidurici]AFS78932.1 hypothetical protein DUF364 [Gottschalkia acidurici 9a]
MKNKILSETIDKLYETLGDEINSLTVERIVFGLFFTGVKLSNGKGGLSYTPIKALSDAVCCPSSAYAMPTSGKMTGKNVRYFLENMFSGSPLKKTLGIAVINALATTCWSMGKQNNTYIIESSLDPIDKIEVEENTHTVIVGALVPYIKMLIKNNRDMSILELDPTTLKGKELDHYVPSERANEVIPIADYVIITGTTLINDTLEGLLELAKPTAKIIVVGPTVSMMPEAFLREELLM